MAEKQEKVEKTTAQEIAEALGMALGPVLKDVALTKEKLDALRTPYVDPKLVERDARERENTRKQFLADRAKTKANQDSCPHKDDNEKYSISLVHNFPDRQTRGVCVQCHKWFEPRHWVIEADGTAEGHAVLVDADPLYNIIQYLDRKAGY